MIEFETELPWPPSANRYYRSIVINKAPRVLISREGRTWRQLVALKLARHKEGPLFKERLAVEIIAYPPDRRRRDLDNLLKPLVDSLEHARLFENDWQIDDLHIRREAPEKPGRVVVRVRACGDEPL